MQWNGARPDPSRPAPLRALMDILQEKAAPAINEYGERQLPGYGGGLFNSIVRSGTEMAPGLGDVLAAEDLQTAAQNNDWGGIGLGILGAIPGIPAIGRTARGGRRARADSPLARMGEFMADSSPAPSRTSVGQTEAEAALARYQAANPNDTGARVLSPGDEGYPTNAQWDEASQAYVAPTPSPAPPQREPYLQAAVRADGKVYRGNTHIDAVAAMPPDVRRRHGMDGNNRGYVNDRGRFLNRAKAQDYARDYGLFREDAPSWVSTAPELASEYLRPYSPPAPVEPSYPIRAFHGSPHSFDRFSLDKIGTGEGAQAYGHGLYFAESEDVARGYRDTLAGDGLLRPDGTVWNPQSLQHMNVRVAANQNGADLEATIARAREVLGRAVESSPPQTVAMARADLAELEALRDAGGVRPNPGSMYEVGINAHPDTFLDWDRPLSEQPENVRQAVSGISDLNGESGGYIWDSLVRQQNAQGAFGEHIADLNPAITTGPVAARRALSEAGVPGIRYLDAGSRGSGEGSRNYVLFNDELVKILRKYGISGLGIGTGSAALLGSELERRGQAQEF